jgi:hypothetical protein
VLVPPSVSRTELRQADAAVTVIERMPGSTGPYVESVTVDGEPWESISIPHKLVASGVHIAFTLSDTPTGWAAASRPVSASDLHGYLDPPNDILPIGASPLTDDTGAHVVAMAAGETLEFSTVDAIASLYTVTVASAGAYSWTVRFGRPDQVGEVQHRVDEVFEWAGQTRVFRIPRRIGNSACTVFQFTADSPVQLTQLELIPMSS